MTEMERAKQGGGGRREERKVKKGERVKEGGKQQQQQKQFSIVNILIIFALEEDSHAPADTMHLKQLF